MRCDGLKGLCRRSVFLLAQAGSHPRAGAKDDASVGFRGLRKSCPERSELSARLGCAGRQNVIGPRTAWGLEGELMAGNTWLKIMFSGRHPKLLLPLRQAVHHTCLQVIVDVLCILPMFLSANAGALLACMNILKLAGSACHHNLCASAVAHPQSPRAPCVCNPGKLSPSCLCSALHLTRVAATKVRCKVTLIVWSLLSISVLWPKGFLGAKPHVWACSQLDSHEVSCFVISNWSSVRFSSCMLQTHSAITAF